MIKNTNLFEFDLEDHKALEISVFDRSQRMALRKVKGLKETVSVAQKLLSELTVVKHIFARSNTQGRPHNRPLDIAFFVGHPSYSEDLFPYTCFRYLFQANTQLDQSNNGFSSDLSDVFKNNWYHSVGWLAKQALGDKAVRTLDLDVISQGLTLCMREFIHEAHVRIRKEITVSMTSGDLRLTAIEWHENDIRESFRKAVSKFSDLPNELLHRYIDEMAVKEVLDI